MSCTTLVPNCIHFHMQHKDLLQLMIDARAEGEAGKGGKKLVDSQIIANAVTFMLAGYETTANALSYTSYLLALNPQVQQKLQAEIDQYLEENPVIKVSLIIMA